MYSQKSHKYHRNSNNKFNYFKRDNINYSSPVLNYETNKKHNKTEINVRRCVPLQESVIDAIGTHAIIRFYTYEPVAFTTMTS